MDNILLLNGPNLNLLGTREPEVYGHETLQDIIDKTSIYAQSLNLNINAIQSNHEGALVDALHQAANDKYLGVIFNPGAYSHTSIALHDAITSINIDVVEVHLSNIHAREEFRRHSYVSLAAKGVIFGFGAQGYLMALQYFVAQQS